MNPDAALQYGFGGVLVFVLYAVGKAGSLFLQSHLKANARLVEALARVDRTLSRIAEKLDVDSERPPSSPEE